MPLVYSFPIIKGQTMQEAKEIKMGLVGLGLMGSSITTCLLMAGHEVVAVAPIPIDLEMAMPRIIHHLERSKQEGLVEHDPEFYLSRLLLTEDYGLLKHCQVVVECTIENISIKESVYSKIEAIVSPECILTSNTSAIPISILQSHTKHPERFFGLHWAEPSHTTRFLEII